MGLSPTPTKLSEHVTRSMHIASDNKSLKRWADTMEDLSIWMGSCSSASSRGMLVTILSGLSPHGDQAISKNPGGGVWGWLLDSACCSSSSWVVVAWAVISMVAGVYGPGHPPPLAAEMDPLAWAWCFLLQLHSHSGGSANLDGVIFHPIRRWDVFQNFLLVKVVSSSMVHQRSNTLSAKGQDSPGIGSWAFSAQYQRAYSYAKFFWGCVRQKSWLPNCISGRGMNQSLSSKWWDGGTEWLLSTFAMQPYTLGTSKDAHTLSANSCMLSWPRTSLSSLHHAGVSSRCACHLIHSALCIGEGSGSSGGRPYPTLKLAGSISSPLRNSWTLGSRVGGHPRSSSGWDQSDWLPDILSSP